VSNEENVGPEQDTDGNILLVFFFFFFFFFYGLLIGKK
jgi:hypothetical protein